MNLKNKFEKNKTKSRNKQTHLRNPGKTCFVCYLFYQKTLFETILQFNYH